jgi:hypothetical protein
VINIHEQLQLLGTYAIPNAQEIFLDCWRNVPLYQQEFIAFARVEAESLEAARSLTNLWKNVTI